MKYLLDTHVWIWAIVATARLHRLTLITADQRILAYPHVRSLWAPVSV